MLFRSKPYDHILQLSTITCRHNNKLHDIAQIFPLYLQLTLTLGLTFLTLGLTLTLVVNTDLLSVPKTRMNSNLSK